MSEKCPSCGGDVPEMGPAATPAETPKCPKGHSIKRQFRGKAVRSNRYWCDDCGEIVDVERRHDQRRKGNECIDAFRKLYVISGDEYVERRAGPERRKEGHERP